MDNWDTVLPYDAPSYDRFAELRQSLFDNYGGDSSRSCHWLLPLSPLNASTFGARQFALPQELSGVHELFDEGRASIVSNVGPLIEPVTQSDVEFASKPLPKRLFSHNDQTSTWLSNQPEGARSGWGGGFADAYVGGVPIEARPFSTMITFPDPLFLSGELAEPYQIGSSGAARLNFFDDVLLYRSDDASVRAHQAMRRHFSSSHFASTNLFERDVAAAHGAALRNNERYADALLNAHPLSTVLPSTRLGGQLRAVARAISVRDTLLSNRQIFYVGLGGFDKHSNQAGDLPNLQSDLGEPVLAFSRALQEIGAENDVTLFTASEFGRTLTINGDGTDHGWGASHFVVGSAVAGGRIIGDVPAFDISHDLDAGSGRLIPTTSVEQFASLLGAWFGLTGSELEEALPNIGNFSGTLELFGV